MTRGRYDGAGGRGSVTRSRGRSGAGWRRGIAGLALVLGLSTAVAGWAEEPGRQGRIVELKTAYHTTFDVYEAGPKDAEHGVLLVPGRWGFGARLWDWADRLAALGYRVVAVDYFDGRPVRNERLAREVIRAVDPVWVEADLNSALSYLRLRQRQVIAVAWGVGGAYVAQLQRQRPGEIQALVFYREREETLGAVAELAVPVLEVVTERSLLHVGGAPRRALDEAWRATVDFLEKNFE